MESRETRYRAEPRRFINPRPALLASFTVERRESVPASRAHAACDSFSAMSPRPRPTWISDRKEIRDQATGTRRASRERSRNDPIAFSITADLTRASKPRPLALASIARVARVDSRRDFAKIREKSDPVSVRDSIRRCCENDP